jgi:hypothetical protein
MVAARSETAGRPSGRPILEGGRPLFSGGPPESGQRAAPFGGWAAPVAAGRPAHQLGPIRPLTAHRLLVDHRGRSDCLADLTLARRDPTLATLVRPRSEDLGGGGSSLRKIDVLKQS